MKFAFVINQLFLTRQNISDTYNNLAVMLKCCQLDDIPVCIVCFRLDEYLKSKFSLRICINIILFLDIPLTPKERSLLTGDTSSESSGVRASHSSESVLDAPDSPPPKPARPNR